MNWLSLIVLKLRGADKWPETEAYVYSCAWLYTPGDEGPQGFTTLIFTYRVNGELQTGKATWADPQGSDTYHKGEPIAVRYDPGRPSRSWFPEKQDLDAPFLFFLIIAGAGAIFLIFQVLLFRGGR